MPFHPNLFPGVPIMAQWRQIQLGTMRMRVQSLASLSGLRIRHCHELWCRPQTWLGSHVAVAVAQAVSYSSNWTPILGTSICRGCGPNKSKDKKKKIHGRSKHICKTSADSQIQRIDLWLPRGKKGRGGKGWEFRISRGLALYRMDKQQSPKAWHTELYSISYDKPYG